MPLFMQLQGVKYKFAISAILPLSVTFHTEPIVLVKILVMYSPFTFNVQSAERNRRDK